MTKEDAIEVLVLMAQITEEGSKAKDAMLVAIDALLDAIAREDDLK